MPLQNYSCTCGKLFKKYFKLAKEAPALLSCECGLQARKVFGTTSSSHKIVIDNGIQARSIEIDPNIVEYNEERASTDYSEDE